MTADEIASQLSLFIAPNQITELRALHVGEQGRTFAGWFDGGHLRELARQALALSRQAAGVYFVPNPIDPELAAKRINTVLNVPRGFRLTHDADIIDRRYLIVDLDSVRKPAYGDLPDSRPEVVVPAHWREWYLTLKGAKEYLIPYLGLVGLERPIIATTGNGTHLVYRISAGLKPAVGRDPCAALLQIVADLHSCHWLTVDRNTYTPARMLRVPGTINRKGQQTKQRQHRIAKIIEVPNDWRKPELIQYPESTGGYTGKPATKPAENRNDPPKDQPRLGRLGTDRKRASSEQSALFDAGRCDASRH